MLPILHLNEYKISGPTVLGRAREDEVCQLLAGHGYDPHFVTGDDPRQVHHDFAEVLERCHAAIAGIQAKARSGGFSGRPNWPAIVLRTPKGWTGSDVVDGEQVEGTFRSHQVPLATVRENPEHLAMLEAWLRSYRPQERFDDHGRLVPELAALAPEGDKRMGASPHANGGRLLKPLELPDSDDYAVYVPVPGTIRAESTRKLGELLRGTFTRNAASANFRLFCPDETNSNRLGAVFEVENRCLVDARPGLIDTMISMSGSVARIYLPPDANCLLAVADHCLRSRDYVNLIVIDKQPELQYLDLEAARAHCAAGASMWPWASSDEGADPDVVVACAGDIPTLEALAAAGLLRRHVPHLRVRFVNVST